ncbi:MAG TPA: Holliday junction branch migration protein RuvA [Jiangellaceae bacterium]|nr:Holliday junction branch migration protein RuvA [Jiangellaceae bacterium]
MIAFVRGRVAQARPSEVVVDIGGVGLTLQCTPSTAASLQVGEQAHLPASLVVREDSLTLYGFADDDERAVFELLQTASGIGPRLAQAMLAVHSPDDLRRAVATENLVALTKVPGIGTKGAQRIVIELKDRLGPPRSHPAGATDRPGTAADGWQGQVHAALLGLGWSGREADAALDEVAPLVGDGVDGADVPGLLRAALRTLARP